MRTATPVTYWQPKTSTIPALSIQQPWAWLILHAGKDIENRDWSGAPRYRGPLLIHAPLGEDWQGYAHIPLSAHIPDASYRTGGIVGICTLTDVVTESESPWFTGRYGFVLKDARPLPFVSYPGRLGLFNVPVSSLRFMTPDGPGCVEDLEGSVPFMEQLARGKIAMRLDASVHPTGRLVEYYEITQLSEVQHDRIR